MLNIFSEANTKITVISVFWFLSRFSLPPHRFGINVINECVTGLDQLLGRIKNQLEVVGGEGEQVWLDTKHCYVFQYNLKEYLHSTCIGRKRWPVTSCMLRWPASSSLRMRNNLITASSNTNDQWCKLQTLAGFVCFDTLSICAAIFICFKLSTELLETEIRFNPAQKAGGSFPLPLIVSNTARNGRNFSRLETTCTKTTAYANITSIHSARTSIHSVYCRSGYGTPVYALRN